MEILITVDILEKAGFSRTDTSWEKEHFEKEYYVKDYSSWMYWTTSYDGKNAIKLDLQKGITNNGAEWNVHIDNNVCNSIGSADISTVEQFNLLMEVFKSKFRL